MGVVHHSGAWLAGQNARALRNIAGGHQQVVWLWAPWSKFDRCPGCGEDFGETVPLSLTHDVLCVACGTRLTAYGFCFPDHVFEAKTEWR